MSPAGERREPGRIDGVRLAVLSRRVDGIAARMQNTLLRTARSGVINNGRDFSCCILTADARLVTLGPRKLKGDCTSGPDEPPITARFDDAFGGLRFLQSLPFVRADRIAAVGWSQGGVYALAVINGPSLDRARKRGSVAV